MRKQKNILDLFRDNQFKLNESPSKRTWRQLERRLDGPREEKPLHYYIAAVAGILAIVTVIALVFILADQKKEGYLPVRTNTVSNPPTFPNGRVITLSDFDWLQGVWESCANSPASYEQWDKHDNNLSGSGYVVHGRDTFFVEEMRIEEVGEQIFLNLNLEQESRTIQYQLTKQIGNRLLFTNENSRFPKQVLFELQSPEAFSVTLSNPHPLALNENQLNYLTRRNAIVPQQVVRCLQKVEYQ